MSNRAEQIASIKYIVRGIYTECGGDVAYRVLVHPIDGDKLGDSTQWPIRIGRTTHIVGVFLDRSQQRGHISAFTRETWDAVTAQLMEPTG